MNAMSAGIAVLGLLLSSPAVVIGAMLIPLLMNPVLRLGFGLTVFDFSEVRRARAMLAVAFTALIVLVSPPKVPTAEILARTRSDLFDPLVAVNAALAGSFAIIHGGAKRSSASPSPLSDTVSRREASLCWATRWRFSPPFATLVGAPAE